MTGESDARQTCGPLVAAGATLKAADGSIGQSSINRNAVWPLCVNIHGVRMRIGTLPHS